MTLLEKIQADMVSYMKSKGSLPLSVLRMVKGAVQLETINKKRELTDEEVIAIISKQIKMRNDSIEEFTKANRNDLIDKCQAEIVVLNEYMPKQLTDEEVDNILEEAFTRLNPTSKDIGLIMKDISPKLKGRTDMGKVNTKIKDRLSNN